VGRAAALFREKVKAVEVVDPLRVRFHLKEPWPDFMTSIARCRRVPGGWCRRSTLSEWAIDGFKKHPIGAGPYKFVSQKEGIELVLRLMKAIGARYARQNAGYAEHTRGLHAPGHAQDGGSGHRLCMMGPMAEVGQA